MARPRLAFSDKEWTQLIGLIRIQCTRAEICGVLHMDENTLNRIIRDRGEGSFSLLFEKHRSEGKASLRRAQWKAATEKHNPAPLIWLGKNVLDQSDRQRVDNTSTDGSKQRPHRARARNVIALRLTCFRLSVDRDNTPARNLISYERVSTARQRRSGLGLAAQRSAIDAYAAATCAEVLGRYTEVESGRRNDRPELEAALNLAKLTGATLVIAKLDRLSRNAAFLLTLRDSGVSFVACDMPQANDLTVGIMALVAEAEREAISRRTREALAAARARGVRLGNPNGAATLKRAGKGGVALRETVASNAGAHAAALAPVIAELQSQGHASLRALANELNARGMRTRRGGKGHVSTVRNLLRRIQPAEAMGSKARSKG